MDPVRIEIKPLSVNKAWKGKRYKTKAYNSYILNVLSLLPPRLKTYEENRIEIIFGFSSKGSDIDNPIKPLLDILQLKYNFNDNSFSEINIKKQIVKKGAEFIEFKIYDAGN